MTNGETMRLDPDFRRDPKTGCYCVNCQKDIQHPEKAIRVTVDWETWRFTLGGDDLLGPECAKKLGVNCDQR